MKQASNLKNVWTALATPFTSDFSIDSPAWDKLLLLQKEADVTGIVISGSTGEGSTLSVTEKLSLMKRAKALVGKDLQLMGGVGGSDTAQCVELAKLYEDAGADSLLVVTPPYNKPSLAGLKLHFNAIAQRVKIPLCLYHVPGRTGQKLDAHSLTELCKHPSITMVKEASGDLSLFSEASLYSDAAYVSGDDLTYLGSLAYRGQGVISVISNLFPKEWVAMTRAYEVCDFETVHALHKALFPLNKNLYCEGNPTPLKAALEIMNLCKSYVRPPLAPVTRENREKLESILKDVSAQLRHLILMKRGS
jgi:4-hydroxy-tetrahydrodipicolinate synthase